MSDISRTAGATQSWAALCGSGARPSSISSTMAWLWGNASAPSSQAFGAISQMPTMAASMK